MASQRNETVRHFVLPSMLPPHFKTLGNRDRVPDRIGSTYCRPDCRNGRAYIPHAMHKSCPLRPTQAHPSNRSVSVSRRYAISHKKQQSGPCPFTRNINLLSSRLLRRTQHNELWTYVPTPYVRNVLWCNPSMGQRYGAVLTTSVKSYFCGNFLLMRSTSEPIYSSNSGVRIRISSAKPITKRPMPT